MPIAAGSEEKAPAYGMGAALPSFGCAMPELVGSVAKVGRGEECAVADDEREAAHEPPLAP